MTQDTNKQKIMVIKLGALGDFVQALGAMSAIREHHKDAHITLLTTKPFRTFAEKSNYFDDIWLDDKPKTFDLMGWMNLRKRLVNGQFNRVYDLQNNDRTSIYLKLFPKKSRPEWVGAAKGASHRNTSPDRIASTAFQGHKQTLSLAEIDNVNVDDMSWIKEDLSNFSLKEPFVLFVPGCSPQHPQKRWPIDYYAKTAEDLIEKGYQVVLLGTDAEREITESITSQSPQALDLTGETSLFQIIALAHKAYAAIGNDTGPMHMIGPTNCPSIVLFSSHGDPKKHAPNGNNVHVLQKDNLDDLEESKVLSLFNKLKN